MSPLVSSSSNSSPKLTVKSQGRGRSNSLPTPVVEYLKTWLLEHMHHPYPTDQEKAEMVHHTGIDIKRLNNWFVNNRIRYWKPRMEALQRQQRQQPVQQQQQQQLSQAGPYSALLATPSKEIQPRSTQESDKEHAKVLEASSSLTKQGPPQAVQESDVPSKGSSLTTSSSPSPSSTPSPTIVSDSSNCDDEGDWSDVASIRSKDDVVVEQQQQPPPQLQQVPVTPSPKLSRKRSLAAMDGAPLVPDSIVPRTKFTRKDETLWREVCVSSQSQRDVTLPTLDEAALLFGFANSNPVQNCA